MKKHLKILAVLVLCAVMCLTGNVKAASLHFNTVSANEILGINTFRMNLPQNITFGGIIASKSKDYRAVEYYRVDDDGNKIDPGDGSFKGASNTPYWMYQFTSANGYISAKWENVGWFNDGNGEKAVNAIMTLSNYRNNDGPVVGSGGEVGFNKIALCWILLKSGSIDNGLHSEVQLYFYYANDPNMEPIDMGQAYIGVGGQNSEKRVWNTGAISDERISELVSVLEPTGADKPGINGHQWEWVSYDRYLAGKTLEVYNSDTCVLSYVEAGDTVQATDYDINNGPESIKDYVWGKSRPICTFDVEMQNPTGLNVLTNAGDRHDSWIYHHIKSYTDATSYANTERDKIMYMVQVGRVTNYATDLTNIKGTTGRKDGKPFSVYNFTSGKDVGSVELAVEPIALATEVKQPGKVIVESDGTEVLSTTRRETETLKYKITQQVGNMNDKTKRIDQRTKYTGLVITDTLPEEVEFVSGVAKNQNGTVLSNSECAVAYDKTTHTVTFTFSWNYLQSTMEYKGEFYTFEINTKVKDLDNSNENDYFAVNKAKTTFSTEGTSGYVAWTNEVETDILYDILTKGINTTISEMITEIKGGEDGKTVIFTPELGYYVETVEWQTQPERYAPSTEQLPNVTDIPTKNKVTIPEVKDGTENTYKHETTMTDSVPEDEKDTLNYDPFGTTTFTFNNVDNNHYIKVISKPMKMVINISKEDSVTGKETLGDATFEGAKYTIYTDENCTASVETVTLNKEGYGSSSELPLGKYYIKETEAPEGYLIDENIYSVEQTAEIQTAQRLKVSYHDIVSKDEIKKGRVKVTKYDNNPDSTEDAPSAGAILKLALDSNPEQYYLVTLDENGNGEFYNEILKEFAPYTIPYGKYTLSEVKESDEGEGTHYFIEPTPIDLTDKYDKDFEYRIVADEPVKMHMQVIKTDAVNNHIVKIAGAKFKIWDCQEDKWVEQMETPSGRMISEFVTTEEGYFITPEPLLAGEYIVYETEAPEGYMLNPDWAIPENEADIGDKEKGGSYHKIDKVAMGLAQNTTPKDEKLIYEVTMPNEPLMGKLEITKYGEVLSDVTTTAGEFGEKYTPVYVQKGLPGVTYDIIAAQDIKSPDGISTYVYAGSKVATITTDENGVATTPDLYLGEYKIVETEVPEGYIIDNNIANVTIENNTKDEAVVTIKKELVNPRQKLKLTFKKEFEAIDFEFDGDIVATFGVYTNEDIKNDAGQVVIPQDSLVDIIEYTKSEEDDVTSTIDLPAGKYYVEELKVSYPYTKSKETIKVELTHDGSQNEFITFEAGKIVNTFHSTTLSLIKLPTTIVEDVIVNSNGVVDTDFDTVASSMLEELKGKSIEQVRKHISGWHGLQGAEYEVYLDAECQKPLKMAGQPVTLVSDEYGMMVLENIPIGVYYLKETKAPNNYEVTEEVIRIETNTLEENAIAYRVVKENPIIAPQIKKTDIFTGEAVPNCVFEIYDETGEKVLMHSITDAGGNAHIAVDLFEEGKTYYFKEIEAPGKYKLNTELHEFVAHFDENGEWIKGTTPVTNTRKNIEELIVRKVDDKTGEPLQGCKFSIIALDENGEAVLDEKGDYVYLVKEAVTDENGEYIVEKPYYGFYQFIEVEAPEGYELKEDMEGMTFAIDENSPETVIFEVTNTGDIAVYTLTAIALASILGIVYVTRKNKVAAK